MKRRVFSGLLAVLMAAMLVIPATAAEPAVTVTLDGVPVQWTDATPFIDENGRTMVPLRAVAEAMGLEVEWDDAAQIAWFSEIKEFSNRTTSDAIGFPIGKMECYNVYTDTYSNGKIDSYTETSDMNTAAVLKDGRTYAPLRYLAEFFFFDVAWNEATFTVSLTSPADVTVYYDVLWTEKYDFVMEFYPGETYDQFNGVKIINLKVNGKEAPVKVFTKEELAAMNKEFGADRVAYAWAIDQKLPNGTYTLSWEEHWLDKNGKIDSIDKLSATYILTDDTYRYIENSNTSEAVSDVMAKAF